MPTVDDYLQQAAQDNGVPYSVLNDIAIVESDKNPNSIGDNGTSFGVFQLHQGGGQGDGYTQAQLLNPQINVQLGSKPIAAAYKQGQKAGLVGFPLVAYSATNSGHPGYLGVAGTQQKEPGYLTALQQAYVGQGAVDTGAAGTGTTGTAAPLSLPAHLVDYALLGVAGVLLLGAIL